MWHLFEALFGWYGDNVSYYAQKMWFLTEISSEMALDIKAHNQISIVQFTGFFFNNMAVTPAVCFFDH